MGQRNGYRTTLMARMLPEGQGAAAAMTARAGRLGGIADGVQQAAEAFYNHRLRSAILSQLGAPALLDEIGAKLRANPGHGILLVVQYKAVHTGEGRRFSNIVVYAGPVAPNAQTALRWFESRDKLTATYSAGYTDYDFLWLAGQTASAVSVHAATLPGGVCVMDEFTFWNMAGKAIP
jgi:hypothetical protein